MGTLTATEIAEMTRVNIRQRALRDDDELRLRGIVTGEERKFNPGEPRDPQGQWSKVGGAIKDALKLAGRIKLGDGETLHSSGKVVPKYGDSSMVWAAIDTPRGRELRLGIVDNNDAQKWSAADKGSTSALSPAALGRLRGDLDAAQTKGKAAAKKANAAWDSGQAPTDPVLLGEDAVAEGQIAAGWGDLHFNVYLDDDEPTSYDTEISVGPSEASVKLTAPELRKFLGQLDELASAA
jgi:hypothetical protein